MEHTIVKVCLLVGGANCARCHGSDSMYPHSIVFLCSCGQAATGKADHTWAIIKNNDGSVSLSPSVNWPDHLHEQVRTELAPNLSELFGLELAEEGSIPGAI